MSQSYWTGRYNGARRVSRGGMPVAAPEADKPISAAVADKRSSKYRKVEAPASHEPVVKGKKRKAGSDKTATKSRRGSEAKSTAKSRQSKTAKAAVSERSKKKASDGSGGKPSAKSAASDKKKKPVKKHKD